MSVRLGTTANPVAAKSMARSVTGATGAPATNVCNFHADPCILTSTFILGLGITNYTNAADLKSYSSEVRVSEATAAVAGEWRGRVRGIRCWGHGLAAAGDGDTFSGAGDLAGKAYLIIKQSPNGGLYLVETTNWEAN
jgi:hypothetical protein